MAISLSAEQVRLLRLRAQLLHPRRADSATVVTKSLCGVQAQDPAAAALALRVRGVGLRACDVESARVQERSLVRTWCMRGTLQLLATEDVGWLLPLLGPVFVRESRRRYAELGLDENDCVRGVRAIRDILASQGPLTRDELVEQLAGRGMRLEGQARPHLIRRAALGGVVCLGPDRGADPTYVLLDTWLADRVDRAPAMSREAAVAELARRYLTAYGPATPDDFAAWSGLPLSEARAGWQGVGRELSEVEIAGRLAWLLEGLAAPLDEPPTHLPVVHLVPSYDPYLLGYRSRELAVAPQYAKRVHPGGGLLRPTLLVDGRAFGTWRAKRRTGRLDVIVEPFDHLAEDVDAGLAAEVADLGRFLEVETTLSVTAPA